MLFIPDVTMTIYFTGGVCTDIDECAYGYGGCQMRCENMFGSFKCLCSAGFTLAVGFVEEKQKAVLNFCS